MRERKTGVDWAQEIRRLLDEEFATADKVVLVCDNLNTHRIGSLYEAFPPEQARRLVERLEMHYTPKHGSWLNVAEIELSVMTKQCLDRRIGDRRTLEKETTMWAETQTAAQKGVDWQFTTSDANVRLKRLYPQYQS